MTALPRPALGSQNSSFLSPYTYLVARGWESKSVEAQQSEAAEKPSGARARMTPEQAARAREKEGLRLARQRIVEQIDASNNPRHRQLLELGLAEVEKRLRTVG